MLFLSIVLCALWSWWFQLVTVRFWAKPNDTYKKKQKHHKKYFFTYNKTFRIVFNANWLRAIILSCSLQRRSNTSIPQEYSFRVFGKVLRFSTWKFGKTSKEKPINLALPAWLFSFRTEFYCSINWCKYNFDKVFFYFSSSLGLVKT